MAKHVTHMKKGGSGGTANNTAGGNEGGRVNVPIPKIMKDKLGDTSKVVKAPK